MIKRPYVIIISVVLGVVALPYLLAVAQNNAQWTFGGFLLNPIDGNSYLAKMRIGMSGEWQFSLPYSSEQGAGAYLFLFYIFLGHLTRVLHANALTIFHAARLMADIFLLVVLVRFSRFYLAGQKESVKLAAFLLLVFGSGMGWIAALAGRISADMWVAEMIPFLSMLVNPHFPLGLALLLDLLLRVETGINRKNGIWTAIEGLLLAFINPFSGVVLALVSIPYLCLERPFTFRNTAFKLSALLGPSGLALLFQYWETLNDPLLKVWNAQNITVSPPAWDLLLSLSPVLPLALFAVIKIIQKREFLRYRLLILWFTGGLVLAYVPISLQRRFLLGLFVPVAVLAILGVAELTHARAQKTLHWVGALTAFAFLTNLLVLAGIAGAISARSDQLYFPSAELDAFEWINQQPDNTALIMAPERVGNRVPAYTRWRVVYGHPYETINAAENAAAVAAFYSSSLTGLEAEQALKQYSIDFVWIDPSTDPKVQAYFQGQLPLYSEYGIRIFAEP